MTSERQKAANRANARHSTGPKTPEGKAAVSLNALWHGVFARDVVLPAEDAEAFEDLWNQVRTSLSPEGPIEEFLVDRVVNSIWRLRRLARAETALFHSLVHALKAARIADQVASYEETYSDRLRSRPDITNRAAHTEASKELGRATYERDRDEVLLGRAVDAAAKGGDVFAMLARCETSLERSLLRVLGELRQLQDGRRSRSASPIPGAITVLETDPE